MLTLSCYQAKEKYQMTNNLMGQHLLIFT
jgi:hypothetical protein